MSFQISNNSFKEVVIPVAPQSTTEKLVQKTKQQLGAINQVNAPLIQEFILINQTLEVTQHQLSVIENKFGCIQQALDATKQCLDHTDQSLTVTNEKLTVFDRHLDLTNSEIENLKNSNLRIITLLQDDQEIAQLRADYNEDSRRIERLKAQTRSLCNVMNQLIALQQQNI